MSQAETAAVAIIKVVCYQVAKFNSMNDLADDLAKQLKGVELSAMWALSNNIKAIIAYFYDRPDDEDMISTRKAFWINASKERSQSVAIFYEQELGRPVDADAAQKEHMRHMNKISQKFRRLGEKVFGVSFIDVWISYCNSFYITER